MAMRITTKMMQNTSLRNLNTNKAKQEDLTNQLATGKKISRPSDDPVIAIRALKLNSQLDKIDQYYEKNAEDAESWLDLTASSISTVNDILVDMKKNINQAVNSYQESSERQAIITNLQECIAEIYSIGNSDSGGRSIFTGYRTDMSLTYQSDTTEQVTITEQLSTSDLDTKTFVKTGNLKDVNEGNFSTITDTEYDVETYEVNRIRLSYDNVDSYTDITDDVNDHVTIGYVTDAESSGNSVKVSIGDDPSYEFNLTVGTDADGKKVVYMGTTDANVIVSPANNTSVEQGIGASTITLINSGNQTTVTTFSVTYDTDGTISITDSNNFETVSITATTSLVDGSVTFDDKYMNTFNITGNYAANTDDAYMSVIGEAFKNNITYVADTGEILLGSGIYKRLSELSSSTELRVTYDKTNWEKDDLDPVHYFYTQKNGVEYNKSFLDDPSASGKQIIEYDIGNNQSIRVNTTADEIFTHDMGRDADEVMEMLNEYSELDESLTNVKNLIDSENYSGDDLDHLNQQKEAIEKAMTYVGDKITNRCSQLLTNCDYYAERTQLAETNCGSRGTRLTLIKNRLNVQQTNFEELVSENEDADYTDLAIQLKSVEMTYEAALSSISYVMQTTLLDFI